MCSLSILHSYCIFYLSIWGKLCSGSRPRLVWSPRWLATLKPLSACSSCGLTVPCRHPANTRKSSKRANSFSALLQMPRHNCCLYRAPLQVSAGGAHPQPPGWVVPRDIITGTVLDQMRAVDSGSYPLSRQEPLSLSNRFRECWASWPPRPQCYSWACLVSDFIEKSKDKHPETHLWSPEPPGYRQCVQTSAFTGDYWEATRPLSAAEAGPRDRGLAYWCYPHKAATPAVWEGTEARQAWRYSS